MRHLALSLLLLFACATLGAAQYANVGTSPVNAQTGTTYTVKVTDKRKLVTHSNGSAVAVTLPRAGTTFSDGWYYDTTNLGAGTVTITPTTSTIDGAATLTLTTNQGVRIVSNGVNYFTVRGKEASSGTVTSVSVTTANGISGTVATSTTTPAITLDIAALDAAKIADGTVSSAEYQFIGTLASNAQAQLDAKAPLASPLLTGVPAAPTAAVDTNTTQLATTAYVVNQAYAKLAGPTFTGVPAAPTAAVDTSTTQLATTAYVVNQAYAKLAGPTFTGTPTLPTGTIATTQSAADSSTKLATTAFVTTADNLKANLASPTLTGTPAAPTAAVDTATTQLATTAYVVNQAYSKLAGPTFTGVPAAPTAAVDTNTTQLATTAYVIGQAYAKLAGPTFTGVPAAPTAAVDTATTQLATTAYVVNQAYAKIAAPTFTTSATVPLVIGGTGTTSTATIQSTSSGSATTGADVILKPGTAVTGRLLNNGDISMGSGDVAPAFDGNTGRHFLYNNSTANGLSELGVGANTTNTGTASSQFDFVNTSLGTAEKRIAAINVSTGSATNSGNLAITTFNAGTAVTAVNVSANGVTGLFKGADVASSGTITITGNLFHVTGTTNITSVSGTGVNAGTTITIIFDGVLTFTDGSNLKLAGNFVTTADDTITITYDGTNWYEVARAVN